jgi:hypothetical protein
MEQTMKQLLALIVMTVLTCVTPARAETAEESFSKNFADGKYGDLATGLKNLAATGEAKARTGLGALAFLGAVEHLGQSFYKHGMNVQQPREMAMMMPMMRLPIPPNPNPEKLTYAKFRTILETFVANLDKAETEMAALGDTDIKLPVDFTAIRLDFNSNGKADPGETLGEIMQAVAMQTGATPAIQGMKVNFDTADIYWLRGYSRLLSSTAQFLLAHDFERTFNVAAFMLFPGAGDGTGEKLMQNRSQASYVDGQFGDIIAMLHTTSWPVIDAAKREDTRLRLVAVTDLATKTWAAVRKETDNDLEWLPNPKQKQGITGTTLTDQEIDGWLTVMTEFREVLEGRQMFPHWRFDKGANLKRWFNEEKTYDLVLLITGTTFVNYLEDGPVSDSTKWNNLMRAFSGSFMGYAVWFN